MGIIYYELLFGNIPGDGDEDSKRIKDINKNGLLFPSNIRISEQSRDFLKGTIVVDEKKRWDWNKVLINIYKKIL
jgi:serine/threonine protein kinase